MSPEKTLLDKQCMSVISLCQCFQGITAGSVLLRLDIAPCKILVFSSIVLDWKSTPTVGGRLGS